MAKQTINIGSTANDGTGSTLRVGGDIINDNFNEIYTAFGDGSTLTAPLTAAGTSTLTNKTIDLDANTVTGTLAEFNTALQGDSFVSLTGSETLTNKTLTTPTIAEIDATGDFTIDAVGDIKLDAGGGDVEINDDGTVIGKLSNSSSNFQLTSIVQDKDFVIKGNDGGSFITALTLDMSEAGAATFGGAVTVTGNLTVNGTTTTASSTNTVIADTLIELGNGTSGTPANDSGFVIERGSADNAFIGFDESADKFTVGTGSFTGASTGNLTISTGTLVANIEGNLTGNVTGNTSGTAGGLSGTPNISVGTIASGAITITNATNAGGTARNVYQSTSAPGGSDGAVGDLWVLYS